MVHFEKRHVHVQKGEAKVVLHLHNMEEEEEEDHHHHGYSNKKFAIRPKLLSLVLLSLLACTLILATSFFFFPSTLFLSCKLPLTICSFFFSFLQMGCLYFSFYVFVL